MIKEPISEDLDEPAGDSVADRAMENYKKWQDAESKNINQAQEAIRFVDNLEQWPEKIKKEREIDGRPCLVINKVSAFVKQVVNDQRQSSTGARVRPVDSKADVATAKIYNGLIKNIEEQSSADAAYDTAFESAVKAGWGYVLIETEYADDSAFDLDIKIRRAHNVFAIGLDPSSKEADGSDANYGFEFSRVLKDDYLVDSDLTDFKATPDGMEDEDWFEDESVLVCKYFERTKVESNIVLLSNGETYTIEPEELQILINSGAQILKQRKVETYKVTQYLIAGGLEIESSEFPSKYIPIVPVYGNVAYIDGERYMWGMVRDAMDPARMYNYWRTTTTEQIALAPKAPFIGPIGFVPEGHEGKWQDSNRKNYAYLEYDPEAGEKPERQFFSGTPMGALQETMSASEDIKASIGMFDPSIGAESREVASVAIRDRDRQGANANFNYADNLHRSRRHVYRILIDMIPRVYDAARVIRILNPDNKPEMVTINKEFFDKEGKITKYDLSLGKYDVAIDTGPSYTTQRQEASETMMEFARVYPQAAPLMGDLIAKNMDWPGAEEIAERTKAMLPPQVQGKNPQLMQAQAQIQKMDQVIKVLQSQIANLQSDKSMEAKKLQIDEQKVKIDEHNAQTKRLDVVLKKSESNEETKQEIVGEVVDILTSNNAR